MRNLIDLIEAAFTNFADTPENEARLMRAHKLGFDIDTVWYHGTNRDFDRFDADKNEVSGLGKGIYLTFYPNVADRYANEQSAKRGGSANVWPVFVRGRIAWNGTPEYNAVIEKNQKAIRDIEHKGGTWTAEWAEEMRRRNFEDAGFVGHGDRAAIVVFDGDNIRSIYDRFEG